ncbi:MAG: hypothetical protein NTW20_17270, partial [Rhodobacterales bacterium]|nr:hypothetical protein [Rhodobacterales bacterium]
NISFTIIKVNDASARTREARSPRPSMAVTRPKRLTTVVTDPMVLPLKVQPVEADASAAGADAAAADPTEVPAEAQVSLDDGPVDTTVLVLAEEKAAVVPRRIAAGR